MKIASFRSLVPRTELISSLGTFTASVKHHYADYVRNGFYEEQLELCMYVYEIQSEHQTHTGILCNTHIEDSLEGNIIKHENTLASKEQDMMYMLMERKAMIKPILLAYQSRPDISELISRVKLRPVFQELIDTEESKTHRFWQLTDEESVAMQEHFHQVDRAYIADGHHRHAVLQLMYERADEYSKSRYSGLFTAYFDFDQLKIYDYNRIVQLTQNISYATVMAKLSQYFDVEVLETWRRPQDPREICLMMNYENYALRWKQEVLDGTAKGQALDVDLFNNYILRDLFDVRNIREDARITYMEGVLSEQEMIQKVYKYDSRIGFLLYPVAWEELLAIADASETMPPKSTWFEPRMLNGLISQVF